MLRSAFLVVKELNQLVYQPGHEVIKKISCSFQLSMKFFLLINVKKPTIVAILTFMSKKFLSL